MTNLFIDIPQSLLDRIKSAADQNGRSVGEELRALLESRFSAKEVRLVRSDETKAEALRRIRERWKDIPETTPEEVQSWFRKGRGPA
jgi:hypothetical protein